MAAAAILPVKHFGAAKQRLADALGAGTRAALASAMFADVLGALEKASALERIVIVSGEPGVRDIVAGREAVVIPDVAEKGQSHAARAGLARASALGCKVAALVPSDCPLMDPAQLDELVRKRSAGAADVLLVPDRHRSGTNALVLDPAGSFEPQFGPNSMRRHLEQAERRGLRCSVEQASSLELDIDTPEDLVELVAALERAHGRAQRTEGVLRQIEKTRHPRTAAA